jgi:hypothetical protein
MGKEEVEQEREERSRDVRGELMDRHHGMWNLPGNRSGCKVQWMQFGMRAAH